MSGLISLVWTRHVDTMSTQVMSTLVMIFASSKPRINIIEVRILSCWFFYQYYQIYIKTCVLKIIYSYLRYYAGNTSDRVCLTSSQQSIFQLSKIQLNIYNQTFNGTKQTVISFPPILDMTTS